MKMNNHELWLIWEDASWSLTNYLQLINHHAEATELTQAFVAISAIWNGLTKSEIMSLLLGLSQCRVRWGVAAVPDVTAVFQ